MQGRSGRGGTVRCVSNEQVPESLDAPVGAPVIDSLDRLPGAPPIRILADDVDLVCIDDACAPANAANAADLAG